MVEMRTNQAYLKNEVDLSKKCRRAHRSLMVRMWCDNFKAGGNQAAVYEKRGTDTMRSEYIRLSLSRSPRDSLKCFEICVPQYIRFSELSKNKSNNHISQMNTVGSRYLGFQGTLWNTSRYPYLDISDLQNWGKNNSNNHIPLFRNIFFLPVVRFSCLGRDQIFTSR